MFQIVLSVATLALMIFALVDVITSEEWQIRHLPKVLWILLIIFLPLIGSIIWIAVGKDRSSTGGSTGRSSSTSLGSFGDPARSPSRQAARNPEVPVDDDEAIEREIAYHEKQAEIRRLEAELRRKRDGN